MTLLRWPGTKRQGRIRAGEKDSAAKRWNKPVIGVMAIIAALLLTGCGSLSPAPRVYVLGYPMPPAVTVRSETGLPIAELKTVSIPDYLDSTDILRRTGPNEITASPTGQWGERLSRGLTDALASALSKRLPDLVVTTAPTATPAHRIFVDIESLDIGTEGRCLLEGRWRITDDNRQNSSTNGQGLFSETAASIDDSAVVMALTRIVDQLAEQVAKTSGLE
ncbi:MAG TPA: PqiC family protein [Telmatospirillum sp.]|nr:PqiC family protein [Telmatospirillum sp.]